MGLLLHRFGDVQWVVKIKVNRLVEPIDTARYSCCGAAWGSWCDRVLQPHYTHRICSDQLSSHSDGGEVHCLAIKQFTRIKKTWFKRVLRSRYEMFLRKISLILRYCLAEIAFVRNIVGVGQAAITTYTLVISHLNTFYYM